MINILDYPEVIRKIGVENLSDSHKKAHDFISEGSDNFTNMDQMAELMDADADIRKATEKYLSQLEEQFNAVQEIDEMFKSGVIPPNIKQPTKPRTRKTQSSRKQNRKAKPKKRVKAKTEPKPQPPAQKPAKAPKPAKAAKPKATKAPKAPVPAPEPDNRTKVEKVPTSVAYINRYRLMNGKTLPKEGRGSVLSYINSLQKAIEEKVIRKTDQYAKEIMDIQKSLIASFNAWKGKGSAKVQIDNYDHYLAIVQQYVVAPFTVLIKRYLKIQGKDGVKKEANNLVKAINKFIDAKQVTKEQAKDMLSSLEDYISDKTTTIQIETRALNGLKGLAGVELNGRKKPWDPEIHKTFRLVLEFNGDKSLRFWDSQTEFENMADAVITAKQYIANRSIDVWDMPYDFNGHQKDFEDLYPKPTEKQWLNSRIFIVEFPKGFRSPEKKNKYTMLYKDYDERKPLPKKAAGRPANGKPANINGYEQVINDHIDSSIKPGDTVETPMGDTGTVRRLTDKLAYIVTPDGEHTVPRKMIRKLAKGINGPGIVNSMELKVMQFDSLGLGGKYASIIGDPSEPWSMMIYGAPGSGKSTMSIEFAHILASQHNRKVAYVAKEEGIGATIQEKFARLNAFHPNIDIHSNRLPDNPAQYQYIFIDSVNEFGIDYDQLSDLQHKWRSMGVNPMYVFKGTKDGNFRGSLEFEHLVDVSIKTEDGIARTEKSRYGGKGALVIYTDEMQNIPKFSDITKAEGYRNKAKSKMHITLGEDGKYWVITPAKADLMRQQGFEIF